MCHRNETQTKSNSPKPSWLVLPGFSVQWVQQCLRLLLMEISISLFCCLYTVLSLVCSKAGLNFSLSIPSHVMATSSSANVANSCHSTATADSTVAAVRSCSADMLPPIVQEVPSNSGRISQIAPLKYSTFVVPSYLFQTFM